MSSFNRRHLLKLSAALPLAGCGFTPVYGPDGPGRTLRGRIAYQAPATPEGFRLRARLEERLGRVERGDFLLTVELDISEEALVISSSQNINRFNLPGTATWTLSEPGAMRPLKAVQSRPSPPIPPRAPQLPHKRRRTMQATVWRSPWLI